MSTPINFISEAMIALVNASKAIQEQTAPVKAPLPSEGLQVSLTDEKSPVRIQHGETWLDLSFRDAAQLMLDLAQIGQVREYAQELQSG